MSLVECPACSRLVDSISINAHLDAGCPETMPPKQGTGRHQQLPPRTLPPARQVTLFDLGRKRDKPELSSGSAAPAAGGHSGAEVGQAVSPLPAPKRPRLSRPEDDPTVPLAELARPKTLEELLGQDQLVGDDSLLKDLILAGKCPSLILWGNPGCGKTTLARLIGKHAAFYREISAVKENMAEVKAAAERAAGFKRAHPDETRNAVLFVDEVHRFNKAQQDFFLPFVEKGEFTLVAATTENPSFRVISALLSRCRTVVMHSLSIPVLETILTRATEIQCKRLSLDVQWDDNVLHRVASACDGDARSAINALQLVIEASVAASKRQQARDRVLAALQKSHLLYDQGDSHFDMISALHKSMRGSDADAALYWMGRMLFAGEDPLYIVRRLIRFASEDVGLADPQALVQAIATWQAVQFIGMPECGVCIAQCVVYLARAPKSVEVYRGLKMVEAAVNTEVAYPVPLHLRNAPTSLMQNLGYSKGYKYNPDFDGPVEQDYLPPELIGRKFL
ncbi:DNA polymerase III, clamp loader complex, gamma/delta/delta subunit [Hyaloraphidium curvatum]|nr:DNA polymerase III, clamp loader complex, gamma/delta/delta subunit [Hyaloraphidium curvatum]